MDAPYLLPLILPLVAAAVAGQTRAVFYMEPKPGSVQSFLANAEKIDVVAPSVYGADEQGNIRGSVDPKVLDAARKNGVVVMPIVVNPGFRQDTVHKMLESSVARARLARALLEECRRYRYRGFQLDFENITVSDRQLLSDLVRDASALLATGGFKLSIAVMYQTSDVPGETGYARWLWDNWLGVYDLAEISKHVEFVSVMTYDQHTERTPPGPIAGFPWVERVLQYCLKLIPKEKFSLGIPLYGRRWHASTLGKDAAMLTATVHAREALALAAEMKATPQWDETERAPWFSFYRDNVREYVFYNDARAFRERYELARRHNLHSFSAWVLGVEDPEIWKVLPLVKR